MRVLPFRNPHCSPLLIQGPVNKFYGAMYGETIQEMSLFPELKAIRLWSDWNSQIHHWAHEKLRAQVMT